MPATGWCARPGRARSGDREDRRGRRSPGAPGAREYDGGARRYCGASLADVAKTTVFVTDIGNFAAGQRGVRRGLRRPSPRPSTVQVSAPPGRRRSRDRGLGLPAGLGAVLAQRARRAPSLLLLCAASSIGVKPPCWAAFGSAPASSSSRHDSTSPFAAALCNGCTRMSLRGDRADVGAGVEQTRRTASAPPRNAAKCNAVNPSADHACDETGIGGEQRRSRADVAERGRVEHVDGSAPSATQCFGRRRDHRGTALARIGVTADSMRRYNIRSVIGAVLILFALFVVGPIGLFARRRDLVGGASGLAAVEDADRPPAANARTACKASGRQPDGSEPPPASATGRSGSRPSARSGSGSRAPRRAWRADAGRARRPCARRRSTRSPTPVRAAAHA